jgi:hypothetical protein
VVSRGVLTGLAVLVFLVCLAGSPSGWLDRVGSIVVVGCFGFVVL